MSSASFTAFSTIGIIASYTICSEARIFSGTGFVTGCFATKMVQQSSNGSMEVSYVPIFWAMSMISCLSKAITGR